MTDFGLDTSCTDELRPGQLVSGPRLVAEAVYRRITTPRGSLRGGEGEADYGLDLTELFGAAVTKSDIAAIPGRLRNEILKDERIDDVQAVVTATKAGPGSALTIEITCTTFDDTFVLAVSVDEVTTQLIGIST